MSLLSLLLQASDDSGHVFYMDSRKETLPVFTLRAHESALTELTQCRSYDGRLATVAMDAALKIWDTRKGNPNCGGLTCVAPCPEANSILVLGSKKCLTIYDLQTSSQVRKHFGDPKIPETNTSVDEAMDGLTLNTMESDEDELNEYLGNISETVTKSKTASLSQANRKKRKPSEKIRKLVAKL
ncbi:PWP1 [Bugula neritina]|uniref:PWP1 n=1 Tax=Bugula neritina TaxID=10212 RepID=A0A7J7K529_BUGNE|nr:PWP1 [Bugula neritina]